jgi:hypothetical protein
VPLVGHPDRGELARAQQLGEAHRITPVCLDPLARFLGESEGATTMHSCPRLLISR